MMLHVLPEFMFFTWIQHMVVVHYQYIQELIQPVTHLQHLNKSVADWSDQALGRKMEQTEKISFRLGDFSI